MEKHCLLHLPGSALPHQPPLGKPRWLASSWPLTGASVLLRWLRAFFSQTAETGHAQRLAFQNCDCCPVTESEGEAAAGLHIGLP